VLEQRYGAGFHEHLDGMFDEAGLPRSSNLEKVPSSRGALMVAELARDRGAFAVLHPRLFDAYWARALDIGDEQVLVQEGTAVGLTEDEILSVVREHRYLDRVDAQTRGALALGAGGVPAWVIDERLLVPGAQPHEVFERVLDRLGHQPVEGQPR
jgi:predicted DsbA family dithiol-disulfide isomerase